MSVKFNEEEHVYSINDEKFPSVTQMLNIVMPVQPLIYWSVKQTVQYIAEHLDDILEGGQLNKDDASKLLHKAKEEHEKVKEEAGTIGTKTHTAVEYFLKYGITPEDEDIKVPFNAFLDWENEHNLDVIFSEVIAVSKDRKYAGTLDILGYLNGELYVIDLKTSKGFYETMIMQIAAYKQAIEESGGVWKKEDGVYKFQPVEEKIEKLGILRLDKNTGKPHFKEFNLTEYNKYKRLFNYVVKYYHLKRA